MNAVLSLLIWIWKDAHSASPFSICIPNARFPLNTVATVTVLGMIQCLAQECFNITAYGVRGMFEWWFCYIFESTTNTVLPANHITFISIQNIVMVGLCNKSVLVWIFHPHLLMWHLQDLYSFPLTNYYNDEQEVGLCFDRSQVRFPDADSLEPVFLIVFLLPSYPAVICTF